MANKPAPRNWNDVQMVLATMAMALTLGLWNLFAQPDRALAKENTETAVVPPLPPTEQPNLAPTPLPQIKIMLGGAAPQLANQSQPASVTANQPAARRHNNNNDPVVTTGGGGGGGGSGNPPPADPPPAADPPPSGGGGGGGSGGS